MARSAVFSYILLYYDVNYNVMTTLPVKSEIDGRSHWHLYSGKAVAAEALTTAIPPAKAREAAFGSRAGFARNPAPRGYGHPDPTGALTVVELGFSIPRALGVR